MSSGLNEPSDRFMETFAETLGDTFRDRLPALDNFYIKNGSVGKIPSTNSL